MSGGADGNLSDSSSAVSGLSLRDGNNQGQLVNHNLNLSTSSTSCDAHDPRTLEILRLRAEQQTLRAENPFFVLPPHSVPILGLMRE